jgi:hexosaminidase
MYTFLIFFVKCRALLFKQFNLSLFYSAKNIFLTAFISFTMNDNKILSSLFFLLIIFVNCNNTNQKEKKYNSPFASIALQNIIPKPVEVTSTGFAFELTKETNIILNDSTPELLKLGQYLSNTLQPATGFPLNVVNENKEHEAGNIFLSIAAIDSVTNKEGYILDILPDSVLLRANTAAGLFRGIQTLRQLLPTEIEADSLQLLPWQIPTGKVKDYPSYEMRGAMLDVARHFFEVEDVKRYIDLISFYKMNVLHLHLSDDQGWRIEIKKWPKLTTHGGSTKVGGGKGGFFTQEQYKEIVQYAREKYITIIPEIDMPGHTNAALASYPALNCNPNNLRPKLYTGMKVGFSTLCTSNEKVYAFIDDVIGEIAAITPGKYFHIGGDECIATTSKEYIKFIQRAQATVKKYGKQTIGWDEIATSTLQPNSIAQYWLDAPNSLKAVKQGAKILMSPAKKAYLDMKYNASTKIGLAWAGYTEIDDAYNWDPATLVKGIGKENIIGVEAPLWTETVKNIKEIEYMAFPRIPGYAEIGWSPSAGKDWNEYKVRLGKHGKRMKAMNINFYKSSKVPWQ